MRRLSIRGGEFSLLGDNQQEVLSSDNINVIIVNAAPVSRAYFGAQ